MIRTVNTGHELYIYCNNVLIYKCRLNNIRHGLMFHNGEGLTQRARRECPNCKSEHTTIVQDSNYCLNCKNYF